MSHGLLCYSCNTVEDLEETYVWPIIGLGATSFEHLGYILLGGPSSASHGYRRISCQHLHLSQKHNGCRKTSSVDSGYVQVIVIETEPHWRLLSSNALASAPARIGNTPRRRSFGFQATSPLPSTKFKTRRRCRRFDKYNPGRTFPHILRIELRRLRALVCTTKI